MDGNRFDELTRALGSGRSRRGILKGLGASALAAAGVGRLAAPAAARRKRSVGNSCASNNDCASGLCVQESRTRKICRCQSGTDCCVSDAECDDGNDCTADACVNNQCAHTPLTGTPCDDGNLCTAEDACQAGQCVGVAVECPPVDDCHDEGYCDVTTGQCVAGGPNTDFQNDDFNCGSCGHNCEVEKAYSTCVAGSCQCLAYAVDCVDHCRSLCSANPDFYVSRFQDCMTNVAADCEACASWANCYGSIVTGTVCGTVNAGCS
jgi:hypothetical protein